MRAPISLLRHRNGNVVNMMFCGIARDMVLYNRQTNKTLFESNNAYSGRDIEILCTEARKRETGLVYFFHMFNNLESLRSFYVSGMALSFIVLHMWKWNVYPNHPYMLWGLDRQITC
jgi:hypothetical protein